MAGIIHFGWFLIAYRIFPVTAASIPFSIANPKKNVIASTLKRIDTGRNERISFGFSCRTPQPIRNANVTAGGASNPLCFVTVDNRYCNRNQNHPCRTQLTVPPLVSYVILTLSANIRKSLYSGDFLLLFTVSLPPLLRRYPSRSPA